MDSVQQIRSVILLANRGELSKNFFVGEIKEIPNAVGCFRKGNEWYIYTTNTNSKLDIIGGFSLQGAIKALGIKLNLEEELKEYSFSDNEEEIYNSKHFTSIEEL